MSGRRNGRRLTERGVDLSREGMWISRAHRCFSPYLGFRGVSDLSENEINFTRCCASTQEGR
jgi:hypothetical protein